MPRYHRKSECCSEEYPQCFKPKYYQANLTPKQQVMYVLSRACGKFQAKTKGCILYFKLSVFCIDKVFQAHIHLGCPGQDGPVVAVLFPDGAPTCQVNGVLAEGCINECDLVGPLKGKSILKLFKLMDQGKAYINVHTVTYPEGEIRGQVKEKYCHRH